MPETDFHSLARDAAEAAQQPDFDHIVGRAARRRRRARLAAGAGALVLCASGAVTIALVHDSWRSAEPVRPVPTPQPTPRIDLKGLSNRELRALTPQQIVQSGVITGAAGLRDGTTMVVFVACNGHPLSPCREASRLHRPGHVPVVTAVPEGERLYAQSAGSQFILTTYVRGSRDDHIVVSLADNSGHERQVSDEPEAGPSTVLPRKLVEPGDVYFPQGPYMIRPRTHEAFDVVLPDGFDGAVEAYHPETGTLLVWAEGHGTAPGLWSYNEFSSTDGGRTWHRRIVKEMAIGSPGVAFGTWRRPRADCGYLGPLATSGNTMIDAGSGRVAYVEKGALVVAAPDLTVDGRKPLRDLPFRTPALLCATTDGTLFALSDGLWRATDQSWLRFERLGTVDLEPVSKGPHVMWSTGSYLLVPSGARLFRVDPDGTISELD